MGHCFSRNADRGIELPEDDPLNKDGPLTQEELDSLGQRFFTQMNGGANYHMNGGGARHFTKNNKMSNASGGQATATTMYHMDSSPSIFEHTTGTAMLYHPGSSNQLQQKSATIGSIASNSTQQRMVNTTRNNGVEQMVKVVAIYDYNNRVDGDINFRKGDIMILMDNSNNDWWFVEHRKNGVGYAPRNFLARIESLESEEWYAGKIQRSLAEKLVFASNLPRGTFLIRKREPSNEYALTINDSKGNSYEVKHYKIRPLDGGNGFYITTRKIFSNIRDLVAYYSRESGGLCSRLIFPAPKVAPGRAANARKARRWQLWEVWLGSWRGVVEVAIKTMKPGTMSVEAFLAEAQIMKQCNHPKLVRLYAVCTIGDPYYIITEFMINGSLLHYLRKDDHSLSAQALVDMCAQIANGMMYLESRKLVHRDLAARNVLVGEKISGVPEVKVADFGLARKLIGENIYEAQTGAKFPIKWTAPEAATFGNFTVKSDVWSYGILLYEIFTFGHVPYPGMHNREVIEQLELGYRMPRPNGCPDPIYQEMLKCWDRSPDKRPTFEYLFAFFDDYFVSIQPNYVPPSVQSMDVHNMN
uniref:Tyrosine-protein kinase n=1 Tax=Ditylenchus dipsaci TaxID=166011 RepID=A0A915EB30_9BILA